MRHNVAFSFPWGPIRYNLTLADPPDLTVFSFWVSATKYQLWPYALQTIHTHTFQNNKWPILSLSCKRDKNCLILFRSLQIRSISTIIVESTETVPLYSVLLSTYVLWWEKTQTMLYDLVDVKLIYPQLPLLCYQIIRIPAASLCHWQWC